MLQRIHERVHGVIAWVLIILIALTFTLWGIHYYFEANTAASRQLDINGETINEAEFVTAYERVKRQMARQNPDQDINDLTAEQEKKLKDRVLKQLVFTQVVLRGAKEAGYLVTKEQAEQALLQIPQFQEDGRFSPEKFQQALSSASYTPSIFLAKIQEGLILNQQRFALAATAFVLPEEMDRFIVLAGQARDIRYHIISVQDFVPTITVSSEELQQYYDRHKAAYKKPEKVSIAYVSVSMDEILSKTRVSKAAVKRYYNDNVDAYTQSAQWKWAHILVRVPEGASQSVDKKAYERAQAIEKKLRAGAAFVAVMKKDSDDVISRSRGDNVPWMSASTMEQDIVNALTSLQNGAWSEPIRTPYGYEIVLRIDQVPAKTMPLSTVTAQIRETLRMDKAQQVFSEMGDDLTNLSYQNPTSLKEVAQELALPIKTTPLFARKGLPTGVASEKPIIQAAFSDEVLQDGNNSPVITIDDKLLVVLRVEKHVAPSFMTFARVKNAVKAAVIHEKAMKKAQEQGEQQVASKQLPADWVTKTGLHRDDAALDPVILDSVFMMAPPTTQPVFQGVKLKNGDYAVVALTKVEQGAVDDLDREERQMYQDEIEAAFGIVDYGLYVDGLMK